MTGQRMGFGASMNERGCVVLKHVTNNITRSSTAARTSPSRMLREFYYIAMERGGSWFKGFSEDYGYGTGEQGEFQNSE